MANVITVRGHEALSKALSEHQAASPFLIFYADPEENSVSWCPDCRDAEPILRSHMSKLSSDAVVIYCYVGNRPEWKDRSNIFRTDPNYQLTGVPTLMNMATKAKLVEAQCMDEKLVKDFFSV